MKRNLIIDGQILQTDAWHRGMGKYTMQVLQELERNPPDNMTVVLLFNTELSSDEIRFETLRFLCPGIRQIHTKLPLPGRNNTKLQLAKHYRDKLDAYIKSEFDGDDNTYLITSLLFFDFFAEFPTDCHKALLFYDLTPLLFWKDLGGYFPPDLYMTRFEKLFEAELIFAISETTRRDILNIFGLEPDTVVNINGGFTKIAEATEKPVAFSVPSRYMLFPTGNLPHKNNEVAVKGFEQYHVQAKSALPLLITSSFNDESRQRLERLSGNIIFTGNVSDEELEWLYEHAEVVLFASNYEGLGMPVLDAVANQKPIIVSKIPVFEEMSKQAFYYFDPTAPDTLERVIKNTIERDDFAKKKALYPGIMKRYSWQQTAAKLSASVQTLAETAQKTVQRPRLPRLAIIGMHPGIANQIGRLAESTYHSLSQQFETSYYFDSNGIHYRDMERPTFLDHIGCKAFDISHWRIADYKKYDGILYLLDEAALQTRVAQLAAIFPGFAVTESWPKLSRHEVLLKQLIEANQYAVYNLATRSYEEYQKLIITLNSEVPLRASEPNPAAKAILKGGTNKAIIKRLKALKAV